MGTREHADENMEKEPPAQLCPFIPVGALLSLLQTNESALTSSVPLQYLYV